MSVRVAGVLAVAMILGCCLSAGAKKHSQKEDALSSKTLSAPIESVYAAAVAVAGRQWHVLSSDAAAHSLSFETLNTRQENAGGYSTYRVAVTCVAAPAGGTTVGLEITEHGSGQPSLSALVSKSQRRAKMLQDFWDGVEAALKENAPAQAPARIIQPQQAPPPAAQPAPAPINPPKKTAQPAAGPGPTPIASKTPKHSPAGERAALTIKSTPDGADITIDGKFFGNTPTTARLAAGDYVVSIEKAGYKPWTRTVTLTEGGTVTLTATLEGTQ